MIDITNRKLVLETSIKRMSQSGKTGLEAGLKEILRGGYSPEGFTPAPSTEIINLPSGGVVAIEAPRLDDIPDYMSNNGEAELLEKSIKAGINTLLTGPTSCGKTHLAFWTAKNLGREIFTIQGGAGATFERIVAKDKLVAPRGATMQILQDALLPLTMNRGAILYIDEPNAIPSEVLFYLHSAMDDRKTMTYDDGRTLKAAEGFVVIGAMNEGYRGTSLLNPAFRRRTPVVIPLDYLPPKREVKVLKARVPALAPDMAETLCQLAATIRASAKAGTLRTDIGTSALIACGTLITLGVDVATAATSTITHQAQATNDRKAISDLIAAHFGRAS